MRAPDRSRYAVEPPRAGLVAGGPFPDDRIVLERDISSGREEFILDPPISYLAAVPGRDGMVRIIVPRPGSRFRTDLTSVPDWFTWLVPKSGQHLPAALIHDGLVSAAGGERTYETEPPGLEIDRIDADRIFRDAMFDTEVGRIRCYLVWAAVSLTSLVLGPRASWTPAVQWYYRAVAALTLGMVLVLGYAATVDLVDSSWPAFDVPWMHEGGFVAELLTGLAGAVVVPLVLAVLWGRYYAVAAIAGVAVAALIHVTIAVAAVALAYQAAERVLARAGRGATPMQAARRERAAWAVVAMVVLACAVSVVTGWLG